MFCQPGLNGVCEFGGSWGSSIRCELRAVPHFPCALTPAAAGAPTGGRCFCCRSRRAERDPQHRVPEPGGLSPPSSGASPGSHFSRERGRDSGILQPWCSFFPMELRVLMALHRWVCDKDPPTNQWLEQSAAGSCPPRFLPVRNWTSAMLSGALICGINCAAVCRERSGWVAW